MEQGKEGLSQKKGKGGHGGQQMTREGGRRGDEWRGMERHRLEGKS